ncbi:ABC transporter permease subunit [Methylophaga sp.]|jgi:ABC-2 type transport system permease protein|uniref:ABC transporter permease subunit n=1 Tax=Methylophaga sp. TaxID=2024840 RepID=UPI00140131F7|nr:ABC transporter permease subunit [Methylophaga sp.]MTI63401.1 ABC transporter permease [Methylophaga sp.]
MKMQNIWFIMKREFNGYFATPVAYVFIIIFLLLTGFSTFYVGNFFERGEADLYPFFSLHPWLYILLIPAISMRLWAEERKSGSIELLMTLPVSVFEAVLGKFFAAWAFTGLALLLNFPLWITVNYLGNPDNGVILASFLGSLLMAGGFLAIGSCISAITKNQVIAFVISLVISLIFVLAGFGIVIDFFAGWAPQTLVDVISSFSFLTHFDAISKGVIDLRDMLYFISLIAIWLFANALIVNARKAD